MNGFLVTRMAQRLCLATATRSAVAAASLQSGEFLGTVVAQRHSFRGTMLALHSTISTTLDDDDDHTNQVDEYNKTIDPNDDNLFSKIKTAGANLTSATTSAADFAKAHTHDDEHDGDDDDDEMEQEDMFVEPHESFEFRTMEWGGPRRGGRFPEPTRYGDWERKGRCTDF